MKKRLVGVLVSVMVLAIGTVVGFAADSRTENISSQTIIPYSEGSYGIVTTVIFDTATLGTRSIRTALKQYDHYESGVQVWTFTLTGTFSYNGVTVIATQASSSATILNSNWRCTAKNAYCTGASAKGSGTFAKGTILRNINLTLTCSPNGNIS